MRRVEATEGGQTDEEGSGGRDSDQCDDDRSRSISGWLVSDPQSEPRTKQRDNCGSSKGESYPESRRTRDSSEHERNDHRCQECPRAPWSSSKNQSHQTGESHNDDTRENHDRCCLVEWLRINCKRTRTDYGCSEG